MAYSHNPKAIIIGSGIAGLAAAIRLKLQGFDVTVFEKNASPGGKLSSFNDRGYQFDAGPSLFTQPENMQALFDLAGEPLDDYFQFEKSEVSCKYFFESGQQVTAHSDISLLAEELETKLGENKKAIVKYLADAEKLYDSVGALFLNNSLHKRKTWINKRVFSALKAVKLSHLFSTLHKYNTDRFNSPETIQLFNRYATYNGSTPYKAPAMLSLIPHLEFNGGVFYPRGGMVTIGNSLFKLAEKKGVKFRFETGVERIIENEGKVRGVVVDGENHFADVVISNADAYLTYKKLLNNSSAAKKILKQERSSSALIFYWGIKRPFPELELHNILFSGNYTAEFDHIFEKKKLYRDPTVYINITNKRDPSHAPLESENWFVMINVPANSGQDWQEIKTRARKEIITKINRILNVDIEPLIETESVADPVTIENSTGSYMGSLYGTSSNSKMAAFLRHPNFSNRIRGLYFCGGSVHPGGGIPLCFKSAQIAASLVKKDYKTVTH